MRRVKLEGHNRRRVLLNLSEEQIQTLSVKLGVDYLLVTIERVLNEITVGYDLRQYKKKVIELLGGNQ